MTHGRRSELFAVLVLDFQSSQMYNIFLVSNKDMLFCWLNYNWMNLPTFSKLWCWPYILHACIICWWESCSVCIITHCCLLSLVQYAKCPASPHSVWEPVMSGTVTSRDIWLLADVPLFLSLQEPLWCGLPVSRDVIMCSNRDVLYSVNLCPTFMHSVNIMRCQVEARAGKQKKLPQKVL